MQPKPSQRLYRSMYLALPQLLPHAGDIWSALRADWSVSGLYSVAHQETEYCTSDGALFR